ncbi:hypothetical protein SAMN04488129_102225 [Halomonas daqiaonensis]|uniref:Uncharacterized protein n=1 Tax=Halomonas daqiaonensis TaxID=650850 RepID=A0A1H7HHS8_9GAMM|nr:hypothetical protein SAMN04488129_102225 [Halomonas daqiaonensis]
MIVPTPSLYPEEDLQGTAHVDRLLTECFGTGCQGKTIGTCTNKYYIKWYGSHRFRHVIECLEPR